MVAKPHVIILQTLEDRFTHELTDLARFFEQHQVAGTVVSPPLIGQNSMSSSSESTVATEHKSMHFDRHRTQFDADEQRQWRSKRRRSSVIQSYQSSRTTSCLSCVLPTKIMFIDYV
jgi:hypothetical protein